MCPKKGNNGCHLQNGGHDPVIVVMAFAGKHKWYKVQDGKWLHYVFIYNLHSNQVCRFICLVHVCCCNMYTTKCFLQFEFVSCLVIQLCRLCFSREWSTCSLCVMCTETLQPEISLWPVSRWWKSQILGWPRLFLLIRNTTESQILERAPYSGTSCLKKHTL